MLDFNDNQIEIEPKSISQIVFFKKETKLVLLCKRKKLTLKYYNS